ncbi:polysaccharide biosynthesis protein [Listeria aquatica]|uniref:Capsular polysaccharide biosynthesis protein n=1 Tax=Listeria aquatica FSL S10-1188 TaxID=1265818 RepID=W7AUH3_9LIST|nr:polysaccharide biosynthesis protein [Listeria aquatica]EUJ16885.1 capsular polysaccharide biosynthesis protein [Listeria aquatica FSL S10-1188]
MKKKTLVIGAGIGGRFVVEQLQSTDKSKYTVIGILDDDLSKRSLLGVPIIGKIEELQRCIIKLKIQHVVLAIPTLDVKKQQTIINEISKMKITYYVLPSVFSTAQSQQAAVPVLDYSKLLVGREEFALDYKNVKENFQNKTILITGAGGSIGSEISKQVFLCNPKRLILLGHGEGSIYKIDMDLRAVQEKLNQSTEIITIIADIRDEETINRVFEEQQPNIIYHAAAHKHVPLMESNIYEAFSNNVIGTHNVLQAAKISKADQFIMISTDKAVNPSNNMGATKRLAEKLTLSMNDLGGLCCNVVRFGNVLGSRGSVFPKLWEQLHNYVPLTITDPNMKRYFMTIPEASKLVIEASLLEKPNAIFVLDMGEQLCLSDMVDELICLAGKNKEDIPINYVGIRPGEKMKEELFNDNEGAKKISEKLFEGHYFTSLEDLNMIYTLMLTYKREPVKKLQEQIIQQANVTEIG